MAKVALYLPSSVAGQGGIVPVFALIVPDRRMPSRYAMSDHNDVMALPGSYIQTSKQ